MGWWWEIWSRPGDPNFGRVIDDPVSRVGTLHDGVNLLGNGSLAMPSSLPNSVFDQILLTDPVTPSNSVSSLARLWWSDENQTSPGEPEMVFEFIPNQIVPPQNKQDPDVNVAGLGIKSILEYPRTQSFDWDGTETHECSVCDWIWGGRNILSNSTMEDGSATPTEYLLYTDATGGTFTLSDGVDTTSAIAFDASPLTVATRLETDIPSITDVLVYASNGSAAATEANPFFIEFVNPQFGVTLTCNGAGLTGDTEGCTLIPEQVGQQNVSPWTCAQFVGNDICFGLPDIWEASTEQNHTPGGQWSIKVRQPSFSQGFAGAQQVVTVTPGQTYQVSGWIYPTNASDRFGIIIKTLGEETVAQSGVPGTGGAALTANQWNEITITDVVIPEDITQVIVRVRQTDPGSTGAFYIDDVFMYEGLAATTPGEILRLLYESYTDPALQGTIYWDDGSATDTPYLTLDFSDTLDSAGQAWLHDDISLTVFQRQSFLQVLEIFGRSWNYEFRVVPDDVEAGTWLLQVFNPAGMMTDYQNAPTPAIQGGQGDTERGLRRFLPSTYFMVEGAGRVLGRAANTALVTALGKIAAERLVRELPDQDAAQDAATDEADDAVASGLTYPYTLTIPQSSEPGCDIPLTDYVLGDALTVHDPPDVDDVGRFWDVTATLSADTAEWQVQFLPLSVFESPGSP